MSEIKVIDDYEKVDKENIELLKKHGIKRPERAIYTCVICGEKASVEDSISNRGHRLIHVLCGCKCFGEGYNVENLAKCFKWVKMGGISNVRNISSIGNGL